MRGRGDGDRGKLFFWGLRLLFVRDSLPLVWLAGEEDVSLETASVIKGVQKRRKGVGWGYCLDERFTVLKFFLWFLKKILFKMALLFTSQICKKKYQSIGEFCYDFSSPFV